METAPEAARREEGSAPSPLRVGLLAGGAVALAVVLWGGYGHHWSWTGINGSTATLWDWLHLLLLPIAFGVLPIWLSRRTRLKAHHKLLGATALAAFVLLVVVGYVVPWAWTGFTGNKLWDWLELIALPLAVALTPLFDELRSSWTRRHSLIALSGLAIFTAIVVAGYLGNWGWTGFRGNTLWDWLHLLLLPLLLPTVVVPAVRPIVRAGLIVVEEEGGVSAPGSGAEGGEAHADVSEGLDHLAGTSAEASNEPSGSAGDAAPNQT